MNPYGPPCPTRTEEGEEGNALPRRVVPAACEPSFFSRIVTPVSAALLQGPEQGGTVNQATALRLHQLITIVAYTFLLHNCKDRRHPS